MIDSNSEAARITSYADAAAMLRVVQPGLERNEAEHSMMLGLLLGIARSDPTMPRAAILATANRGKDWSFAAIMTPPFSLLVSPARDDAFDDIALMARHIRQSGVPLPGVVGVTAVAQAFADAWVRLTGCGTILRANQRMHCLREVRVGPGVPGRLRLATALDVDLVARWFAAFHAEALNQHDAARARERAVSRVDAGQVFLWEDSEARSMVAKGRPTTNTIAINAVYTPPEWRRKGYATTAVAELSRQLLRDGHPMCVLFTDVSNPVSNSIYRRIGYEPVADSRHIGFLNS